MRFTRKAVRKAYLAASAIFLALSIGSTPGMIMVGSAAKPDTKQPEPLHVNVLLVRTYLDGEISEEIVRENIWSIENFWAKYDQWQLLEINESAIVFTKPIDDISPLLKANGYFGITDKGVLSIFNGKPKQVNIIQSFFQIDIKKLESSKHQELVHGIPIKTKDHYVEVLETFKTYSADSK